MRRLMAGPNALPRVGKPPPLVDSAAATCPVGEKTTKKKTTTEPLSASTMPFFSAPIGGVAPPLAVAPPPAGFALPTMPPSHVNKRKDELEAEPPVAPKRQRHFAEPAEVDMLCETVPQGDELLQQPMALEEPPRPSPVPMPTTRSCPPCFAHRFCRVGATCLLESDRQTYYKMHYADTYSCGDASQPAMMDL